MIFRTTSHCEGIRSEAIEAGSKQSLVMSFVINIFFLALCLIFGDLKYGAVDDYFMAAVLTGAHGTDYNPHLLFVNALYGYALIPLYKLFPTIGWYYIGEMFSVFLSLTTISYIIIKKMGKQWGPVIAALFVALCANDFYLVVQFTQCASLLSAAGMLVFASAVIANNEEQSNSSTIIASEAKQSKQALLKVLKASLPFVYAIFLLLWGSVMRWQAFLMGMPFFCLGLLFIIKQCWTKKIPVIISLAVMFIAAFGLQKWDRSLYDTPEYRPYMEIQGPRASLGDGKDYNQNAVYEDLEESGKSGNDFHMLTAWTFYDTEVFAKDSMQAIVNITRPYKQVNQLRSTPRLLLKTLSKSFKSPICWVWIIACLIILVTNRNKFPYLWASLFVIFSLMMMLLTQNRLLYRVESGFWLYAAMLAIPLWKQIPYLLPKQATIALLATIAVVNTISYAYSGEIVRDPSSGEKRTLAIEDTTDYKRVFDYIDSNPDKMFLLSMNAYMRFSHHKMPPYRAEPFGSYRNTISLGYWTPYLPEITQTLKEYGITNPLKDVTKENVIVMNENGLRDFLTRHYHEAESPENNNHKTFIMDTLQTIGEIHFFKYKLVREQ